MTTSADEFRVPLRLRIQRRLLAAMVRPLFKLLFKVKIIGKENIPTGTSYVLAINHVSLFEPPLVLCFWPEFPEALAGHDVWGRGGFQSFLVKGFGAIPVRRGEYDRESIDTMMTVLRAGKPLMIAPEGGRSHAIGMRRAHAGIAYLVDQANVPVLPVAIAGTYDDALKDALHGKRPTLTMRIGKLFELLPITEKGAARREARQRNADEVMKRIGEMLPEAYHGAYAGMIKPHHED